MAVASMIELLDAGVHFGHQTHRWNPQMREYIYCERNGIYVINLQITTKLLDEAYEIIRDFSARGKNVVFVGTKKQACEIIEQEAKRCGAYYVNKRWLGGTLTNFDTIRSRINKLKELEELKESGLMDRLPKKEVASLTRQLAKLTKSLGGIKDMKGLPDIIFIVDQKRELIAVKEANKMKIPIVAIVDTNCDPRNIDHVIPGNDDALRSIRLITSKIADAVLEGKQRKESVVSEEVLPEKLEEIKPEDAGISIEVSTESGEENQDSGNKQQIEEPPVDIQHQETVSQEENQ